MEKLDRDTRSRLVLLPFPNLDQLGGQELDRRARAAGETFVVDDRLKTHQLRNIFAAIENIRAGFQRVKDEDLGELETRLILLKPKLAYAAGRQRSVRDHLFPFMENAIDAVVKVNGVTDKRKAFRNFFSLLESVVGYHKFFESNRLDD